MAEDVQEPIEANPSPLPDQLWAALRQIAPPIMAYAIGKGWIQDDTAALIGALAAIAWPIIAGQLKTRLRAKQLATVAANPEVPAHVATLKVKP